MCLTNAPLQKLVLIFYKNASNQCKSNNPVMLMWLRKREREGGREGGRKGGREGGREGERERERGREGERERERGGLDRER